MGPGVGFTCFLRGVRQWRERPRLMLLGLLPAVLVAVVLLGGFVALLFHIGDLVGWATPFADSWSDPVRAVVRFLLAAAVLIATGLLAMITFTGLTLAIGDPFYERIWRATEVSLGGPIPEHSVPWWRSARDGLVLVGLGLMTTVVVFGIGLVPVVGPIVGPIVGVLLAGRLLARELVSRAFEARGMDRRAQNALLAGHRGALFGFGSAVQLCFLIPFGAIVVMPAAVAGSTMLAREVLDRQLEAGPVVRPDSV